MGKAISRRQWLRGLFAALAGLLGLGFFRPAKAGPGVPAPSKARPARLTLLGRAAAPRAGSISTYDAQGRLRALRDLPGDLPTPAADPALEVYDATGRRVYPP